MHSLICRLFRTTPAVVAIAVMVSFGSASAQMVMNEAGFTVTNLGSSVGAKKIECSPGGIWGDYIYVCDSSGGVVERIDFSNVMSLFATMTVGAFPVGLAFGPGPGSNFGDYLYVANFGASEIVKVDPVGTVSSFAVVPSPSSNTFDPSGAYGNDMFVTTAYSGPIYKVDQFGVNTPFATVQSLYIKFGPGGAWGSGMYSTSQTAVGIVKVDIAGVATNFSTGFSSPEGFDWAYGSPFDGDMFAADVGSGQLWRVKSDGSRTLWAGLPNAADVAFCNDCLYVVSLSGQCFKVCAEETVPVTFARMEARVVDNAVSLRWDVSSDETIRGFNVLRTDGEKSDAKSILKNGLLGSHVRGMLDDDVVAGKTYRYVVAAVTADGMETSSVPASVTIGRAAFGMTQNFPNPFNPETSIEYTLSDAGNVALSIYDAQGRWIVDVERGERTAGTHTATWDGRNARGETVASGAYFYRLTAGSQTQTKKLVLLK